MEFELSGNTYQINKLSAMEQFHVSRRIAPIIPTLIPIFVKLAKGEGLSGDLAGLGVALEAFADGISKMSDEQSEFVLSTCLSAVRRQTGDSWSPVWNKQRNVCMFSDIDLSVMINLAIRVIKDSLQPFIRGLLTSQQSSPDSLN